MSMVTVLRRAASACAAVLACAALAAGLNIAFSVHLWVTREAFRWAFVPVLETVVVLWLVALAVCSGRPAYRRAAAVGASVLFAVVAIFSTAEALFQYIYGRSFMPAADIPMVRGGLLLLFSGIGAVVDRLTPIATVAIFTAACAAGYVLVWAGGRVLSYTTRPLIGAAAVTAAALPAVLLSGPSQVVTAQLVGSLGAVPSYEFAAVEGSGEQLGDVPGAPAAQDVPAARAGETGMRYALPGIRDRDIYVFVIEAYGKAAFSRESLYRQLEPSYTALVEVLEREGYRIKSHFIESPVAGGFSWLAEAAFLTGENIDVEPKYEALVERGAPSLTRTLHANGYYTMMVRPGTVNGPWPEGWELYRFEDSMIAYDGDFGYVGPWFSFVPITDQFAIWRAHKRLEEVRAEGGPAVDRPVYVHYQLVSSHTPFNRIPPYIADWESLGDGSIYRRRSDEILTFDNTWGGGRELDEGYVASLEYVFTTITEYLARFMNHSRDPILLFFGDHQPQRPIREADATFSVPIHVAARDPEILSSFAAHGYTPGFTPRQPRPHPHFTEFYPMFTEIARRGRTVERPR